MRNLLRILALLVLTGSAHATDRIAASLSTADVQAAINLAVSGDRVVLPAGSGGVANWTSGITWTAPANVTLIGAGSSATGGGDQTIIQDNIASDTPLLSVALNPSGVFRMSGITFRSGTGALKDTSTIRFDGGQLRIDHCHFIASSNNNYRMITFFAGVTGVMDSCILDFTGSNTLYFHNGRDNGTGGGAGNYEWTLPTAFGSANYFFIEDCIINGIPNFSTYNTRIFDGFTAAKVVVRFNNAAQAVLAETHATGHSGDDRGLRSQEIYGNAVTSLLERDPNFVAVDMGNGTSLVWGNSWNNVYKNIYRFNVTRKNNDTYGQPPTPDGWGYAGTQFNGTGSNWDGGTFNATDTLLGYPCLDQPGRGAGDLLTGAFPSKINSTSGTIKWPGQSLEPIYIWNNVGGIVPGWGGAVDSNNSGGRVVSNRDYYLPAGGIQTTPTSPFNGTGGTGWGTIANRPTTCTTGVGYFAIDQGSWNQSTSNPYGVQQNGADGVLYVATATNTWTLAYTPYTYPHPLRGGQVEAPSFSPVAGTYASPQSVTITSATGGATIRYTTNGTDPTSTVGTIYSTPVSIGTTATLKAVAYNGVLSDSNITSGLYTIGPTSGDATATNVVTVELTLP